jgi:proline iminopeptidase
VTPRDRFVAFRRSIPRAPRLQSVRVKARGLEFAVFLTPEVSGATPLVCINGGLTYDHKLLWPALSPLAQARQLILYDQRGRGESQAPPGVNAARIEHDAGDLVAIREALGFRRWDVLGHSWGGGIAMLGAERDRDGVRRLVLVDSVGPTSQWLGALHETALSRLSPPERVVLQRLDPSQLHAPDPAVHSAYSRALYPAWFAHADLAQLFAPPRTESRTGAVVAARLRREGYDWTALVRGVHMDTLVIHGERDLVPASVARELAGLIAKARLELIPGAGHMPFWEAPEHFFSVVERFLNSSLPHTPR